MKKTILFSILLIFCFHISAQVKDSNDFVGYTNGTEYKIIQTNINGSYPKNGDIIKITLFKYDPDGQLVFSTEMLDAPDGIEMTLNENHTPGDIMDVFLKMKTGESAEALIPKWVADNDETLKNLSEKYRYIVELHGLKTQEENKKQQEELLIQLKTQQKTLFDSISNKLLKDYKIYYQKDGLYILIDPKAKIKKRDFIQINESVEIHYILKILPEMKEIDNSYLRDKTLEVKVDNQQVIQGFDIALQKLKPGVNAILLIPSWLAYGFHGTGREIGPNTPLLFKIKIQ